MYGGTVESVVIRIALIVVFASLASFDRIDNGITRVGLFFGVSAVAIAITLLIDGVVFKAKSKRKNKIGREPARQYQVTELVERLLETSRLLKAADESFWAGELASVASSIKSGNLSGLSRIEIAMGGAGSLADLYLCAANGHRITSHEEAERNETFRQNLAVIYSLAQSVQEAE